MVPLHHELVAAVRKHALANYNDDGWDYVVEAYDDEYILHLIGDSVTVAGAIRNVHRSVKTLNSVRRDIQGA
jgi:hypothetical protein